MSTRRRGPRLTCGLCLSSDGRIVCRPLVARHTMMPITGRDEWPRKHHSFDEPPHSRVGKIGS